MPLVPQCVVCAHPLQNPRRADRRYCGSSCRVRAFRVRESRQHPTKTAMLDTRRALRDPSGSILGSTREQLALFRDLRQARQHAAELAAQLAQAKKAAEHQRRERDQERQVLEDSLAAARQQSALLETALADTQRLAITQLEADTQNAERLVAEQHRAAARIAELEQAALLAEAAYRKPVEQLQDALDGARQQLATVDAARVAAEARSQALEAASEELEAEKKRNTALLDKLAELWMSTQAQRTEHERVLTEERQQTAAERQQTSALRAHLREAAGTIRKQRDQLDNTALALSAARAATDPLVKAKLEQLSTDLAAAQKELASCTDQRDLARTMLKSFLKLLETERQHFASVEQELSNQKALLAEVQVKTDRVYAQILRIKEKRDWRL